MDCGAEDDEEALEWAADEEVTEALDLTAAEDDEEAAEDEALAEAAEEDAAADEDETV